MVDSLFASKSGLLQAKKWGTALLHSGTVTRLFNSKPIWAQLKITDRCNLSCAYCNEHKRGGTHVDEEIVEGWVRHCAGLGVKHVEFIGGEPLLHPALLQLLHLAGKLKMNTGLTTNGFLLDERMADDLIAAGICRLQLSIDCIEPNAVTKKAVTNLQKQLDLIADMDIWVHVNSVVTEATIHQSKELAGLLFERGIPVAFSPAHTDGLLTITDENGAVRTFLKWLTAKKDEGYPVNMPQFLIDYFHSVLDGKRVSWTCEGGCKAFYVDTKGVFCTCSHQSTGIPFGDVNHKVLRNNHFRKKGCEERCGVSCMITNSFPFCRLGDVIRSDLFPGKKG